MNRDAEHILNHLVDRLSEEKILDPSFSVDKATRRIVHEFAEFLFMLFENKDMVEMFLNLKKKVHRQANHLEGDDLGLQRKDATKAFELVLEEMITDFIAANPDKIRTIVRRTNK